MAEVAAVEKVRDAVAALSGAGWVSVERCAGTPDGLPWLSVNWPGFTRPLSDMDDGAARTKIEAVNRSAIL